MADWKYRLTHIPYLIRLWCFLRPFRVSHHSTFLGKNVRVYHPENIEMGENVLLCRDVELCVSKYKLGTHNPPILKIGNNVRIGEACRIGCYYEIIIEDNVLFAPEVFRPAWWDRSWLKNASPDGKNWNWKSSAMRKAI